ncbi:MAG TPA: ABC transporter permease [Blastocatellia bacterium]|nr:ABC transporter permease [Blastocatellia bacterium]
MNLSPGQNANQAELPSAPEQQVEGSSVTSAHRQRRFELPEKPVVVIEPRKAWAPLDLSAVWAHRELIYFLTWRDIKVRYKQTVLGAAWALLQPLVTMIIFTYFFGKLAKVPNDGVPYPIFFYTGLLIWTYFSNGVSNAANSLIGNTNLITKVYFPRLIIPTASVAAGLLDFVIASLLLIFMLIYYGFPVTLSYLALLPLVLVTTLFALGVGLWLSALNVKYRDVRYALPFVIQIWMFVSPIIYPSSVVPREWRWLMSLNPITGLVEAFRAVLFNHGIRWLPLAYSCVVTLVLLVYSSYMFRRMERDFAEVI